MYWRGGRSNPPFPPDTLQIDFDLPRPVSIDTLTTEIGIEGGSTWRLPSSPSSEEGKVWSLLTIDDKTVGDGQIIFSNQSDDGKNILSEIAHGKSIHLTVKTANSILIDTIIYTSGASARDNLIRQIRTKIRTKDPTICTDKPPPINYLTPPPSNGKITTYNFECLQSDGSTIVKTLKADKPPKYSICD